MGFEIPRVSCLCRLNSYAESGTALVALPHYPIRPWLRPRDRYLWASFRCGL